MNSVSSGAVAFEVFVNVLDKFGLVGVQYPDVLVQLLEFLRYLFVGIVVVVQVFECRVDFVKLVTQPILLFLVGQMAHFGSALSFTERI